ncbi:hypothetical protein CIB48_g8978 [Xylaria polymorpha]|nr:hypothetical protein CIB48_g8978 [Xylaria polymorpha]
MPSRNAKKMAFDASIPPCVLHRLLLIMDVSPTAYTHSFIPSLHMYVYLHIARACQSKPSASSSSCQSRDCVQYLSHKLYSSIIAPELISRNTVDLWAHLFVARRGTSLQLSVITQHVQLHDDNYRTGQDRTASLVPDNRPWP